MSKKNPMDANRMLTKRKNIIPEPNIREIMDTALALSLDFSSPKLWLDDTDSLDIFMDSEVIFRINNSS
jgi:hypothetical protein